ncbi:ABC transporter permease [Ancylobacter dichloromethanicus]
MSQAAVGTAYIQEIIAREAANFLHQHGTSEVVPIEPVIRALFNQNLEAIRFNASMDIIMNVTMLGIILVGAAVMREREHGTIEHLLVMPVRPSEIAAAKIWANGLIILLAAGFFFARCHRVRAADTDHRLCRAFSWLEPPSISSR